MPKILFDKKRKKRIIHIAGHGKRQRLRKNTLFLKCLHLNCDSQLYILSHPSIHKNPLPGGFLCLLGIFLFVRDDRTAGSFPKQVSGGWDPTAVGSWAGDGMPRITCGGIPRWPDSTLYPKIPPPMNRWGEGKAKGWQCYRMRTRITAGMAASFSASLPSKAPVASSMV